jgi:hypothetical protein
LRERERERERERDERGPELLRERIALHWRLVEPVRLEPRIVDRGHLGLHVAGARAFMHPTGARAGDAAGCRHNQKVIRASPSIAPVPTISRARSKEWRIAMEPTMRISSF